MVGPQSAPQDAEEENEQRRRCAEDDRGDRLDGVVASASEGRAVEQRPSMRGTAVEAGSVQVAGEATTLSKDGDDPGGDDRRAHGDADQQGPARRPADHHRECADGEE